MKRKRTLGIRLRFTKHTNNITQTNATLSTVIASVAIATTPRSTSTIMRDQRILFV
jgi:hypothetical protein